MVAGLMNVDAELSSRVAEGLGMELPEPLPRALADPPEPEVMQSTALSLRARPGDGSVRTRKIALLVADGVDAAEMQALHDALLERGAVPIFVADRLGRIETKSAKSLQADGTMKTHPAVLFDALVLPSGDGAISALLESDAAIEYVREQYRHCKPILALRGASALLDAARIPPRLPDGSGDPGLLVVTGQDRETVIEAFEHAIGRHRHFERQLAANPD
jgi:catalase